MMAAFLSTCRQIFIQIYFMLRLYLHGFIEMLVQPFTDVTVDECVQHESYDGRVALVTGGTAGIGLSVCRQLCELGISVVAAGPQQFRPEVLTKEIRGYMNMGRLHYIPLHLESSKSIEKAVEKFSTKFQALDILINNAGIMLSSYFETGEGFEGHVGVNFIGHIRLTKLLLPMLNKGHSPRVVNVASSVYRIVPNSLLFQKNMFFCNKLYSAHLSYAFSKLAIITYTDCLANQLQRLNSQIKVFAVHPGVVASSLYRHVCAPLKLIQQYIFSPLFFRTVEEGAIPILNLALSKKLFFPNGSYVENGGHVVLSNVDKEVFYRTVGQYIHSSARSTK